jgi:hypothetical protein
MTAVGVTFMELVKASTRGLRQSPPVTSSWGPFIDRLAVFGNRVKSHIAYNVEGQRRQVREERSISRPGTGLCAKSDRNASVLFGTDSALPLRKSQAQRRLK